MSFAIIVGNVHGFRTGEWKGASRRSIAWVVAGIALLIVGVCILGKGNQMRESRAAGAQAAAPRAAAPAGPALAEADAPPAPPAVRRTASDG